MYYTYSYGVYWPSDLKDILVVIGMSNNNILMTRVVLCKIFGLDRLSYQIIVVAKLSVPFDFYETDD